jgi:aminoglycoside 6-adenylyltransferase
MPRRQATYGMIFVRKATIYAKTALNKDDILPSIPAPSDIDYWVKKPTESIYLSCCNDFWWCLQNVGKGIWRDELTYAKQMFEYVIRVRLDEMVS